MTEHARPSGIIDAAAPTSVDTTPAGLQFTGDLARRRRLVVTLNVATYLAMALWMASIMGAGGWTAIDIALFVAFLIATPWTVLGFWNAAIGLYLLHGTRDGRHAVAPFAAAGDLEEPIRVRTAIMMTLRNEDPARAIRRLRVVADSLHATGEGGAYSYFLLSDTNDPAVAAAEEALVETWREEARGRETVVYRRRKENTGYKAGNVRDFCETYGRDYDLMLPLDADSVMTGDAIVRMTRMMQAYPRLGILQSLVVGAPSHSAFARIFQFGMRHGMRPYTMGSAWWAADCGPFWGHNALVRIEPFREQCHLPVLPGGPPLGGHVLSHDQVEATLMRRAGYEVRVLPEENGSYEENPPTAIDFSVRDLRWCQGNLQYLKLMDLPGLLPMSRFQLAWAILMFLGVPAMTLMIALTPLKIMFDGDLRDFPAGSAIGLYLVFLGMFLSPKIAGVTDVLMRQRGAAYGGAARVLAGAFLEAIFSFILGAVTTFRLTVFMIGLAFGRSVVWNGQERDARGVPWATAMRFAGPATLFGLAVCVPLAILSPATLLWSLPLTLGYVVAIPFVVFTAWPRLGKLLTRIRLFAIPEEFDAPPEIDAMMRR